MVKIKKKFSRGQEIEEEEIWSEANGTLDKLTIARVQIVACPKK